MGAVLGIGIAEAIEAIGGAIAGEAAAGAAEAGGAAAEAAAEAASKAAEEEALAGGATQAEAEEAGKAAAEAAAEAQAGSAIASVEEARIQELISKIADISPSLAEDVGNFNEAVNEMISEGIVTEEAAEAASLIEDVTASELEGLGMTASEFEAFDLEASEEFEELSEETVDKFNQIKKLGKKLLNKVKQALLACKKSKVRVAECVVAMGETIEFIYERFFKKGKLPNNVVPSFSSFDPYQVGTLVGELTAGGISEYYDEFVVNPAIAKNEEYIDHLILNSFRRITNDVHNTLARKLYGIIRSSKFIKSGDVQKKFDDIFKVYNGRFNTFPFRDSQGFITYVDEVGQRISYKGKTNKNSVTTFYGTWCGPLSYNDTYPLWDGRDQEPGKIVRSAGSGLLDSFCFAHDCDYSFESTGDIGRGGWFNQVGDFMLISRILHTHHLMTYKEKAYAMMTVAWFSTLGTILNSYLHPLIINFDVEDPIRTVKSDDFKDLFSLLYPKSTPKNQLSADFGHYTSGRTDDSDENKERKEFYRGLRDSLREKQVDFVAKNGSTVESGTLSNLLLHFDSIRAFA